MRIVRCAVKPSLRTASCCRVEVVNGAAGLRRRCFFSTVAHAKLLRRLLLAAGLRLPRLLRLLAGDAELPELLATVVGSAARRTAERRRITSASMVQYSRCCEALDLLLALRDHAQRRALHAARGEAAADLSSTAAERG